MFGLFASNSDLAKPEAESVQVLKNDFAAPCQKYRGMKRGALMAQIVHDMETERRSWWGLVLLTWTLTLKAKHLTPYRERHHVNQTRKAHWSDPADA